MGVSSRAILAALVDGRAEPATMAELARGRLRSKVNHCPLKEAAFDNKFCSSIEGSQSLLG